MKQQTQRLARACGVFLAAALVAGCGSAGDATDAYEGATPTSTRAATPASPPTPSTAPPTSPAVPPPSPTPAATPAATPPATPPTPSSAPAPTNAGPTLRRGDSGPAVALLQQRLLDLDYWLPAVDGQFGLLTSQAVLALQGAAGLTRDSIVGVQTRVALEAGVRPVAASASGQVAEVHRDRGLLLFVRDGVVRRALHTSTGTFEPYWNDGVRRIADTPGGTFEVTWVVDGWRDGDLGLMYRPRYFHPTGIAIHGYGSVPAYPASHGCVRVTIPAMDMIWAEDLMPKGGTVLVV